MNHNGALVKLGRSSLGRIIVDSHGRMLYLWAHDKQRTSTCYGKCASAWPPFTTHGKPRAISGARSALLRTTRRRDGRIQLTYHGHPLYYCAGDKRAGRTAGQGLTAFGGRWYAVSTGGTAVQNKGDDLSLLGAGDDTFAWDPATAATPSKARIVGQEPAGDRLEINTLAGTDTVDSAGLAAGAIQLLVDGVLVP